VRPPSLSVSFVWPHGGISQFWCNSLCEGDRFEGRMQDGTITTKSSHGRMGSVSRTPTECHSELDTGVHALRVVRSIPIAASSVTDMSLDSFVLMFWDFYLPPVVRVW
jgi:hypothetical protein